MLKVCGASLLAAAALACGGGSSSGSSAGQGPPAYTNVQPPPGGVAQFSLIPVQPVPGLSLTALGSLNPPGHVLPTDHVYFYSWDLATRGAQAVPGTRDVHMPATGAVFMLLPGSQGEYKIGYRVTADFYFYFDHLVPNAVPSLGDIVQAGTLVGTTSPGSTLDFGAFDASVSHPGLLVPDRYPYQTLHVVSPWDYFPPGLQAQLYAQVYRAPTAPDKDGRVDYGVAGRLAGDWFLHGLPDAGSWEPAAWPQTIAFVRDYYDPSQVRISIGGTVGPAGVWAIDPAAPPPESVSVTSGAVAYLLYSPFDPLPPQGQLLVQMVSDTQIKVQMWMGTPSPTPQFDAGAFLFDR